MPASDEFKKALRSGDLPEAFVMAMGRATELNITTKVVKADGTVSETYDPAQQLHTRLDLLNGTIDNEIGEDFVGDSKYRELQQFHQQQVALGNLKIQENFQSLQQMFRLLVTLQQYNRLNNAEEPLDLTCLEVPSPALPVERVVSNLRAQEEAILETVAGISMPAPTREKEVTPEPTIAPEPSTSAGESELPSATVEPIVSVENIEKDEIKKTAIAPPMPPAPRRSPPQANDEPLNFLDSFAALDLDETSEPEMPLSEVEVDDWETPIELSPAERLAQNTGEAYVPSLNDFDQDDDLDDLLGDDDSDDIFGASDNEATDNNDTESVSSGLADENAEIGAMSAPVVAGMAGISAFDASLFDDDLAAETTKSAPEAAVTDGERHNSLASSDDDHSDLEVDELSALLDDDEDEEFFDDSALATNDVTTVIEDETLTFDAAALEALAEDIDPDFEPIADTAADDLVERAIADEEVPYSLDDLLDEEEIIETPPEQEEPTLAESIPEAIAPTTALTIDTPTVAQTIDPHAEIKPAGTPLTDLSADDELFQFLGQDWQSHPGVSEITSLEDELESEPDSSSEESATLQPLNEDELTDLEDDDNTDWSASSLDNDWPSLNTEDTGTALLGLDLSADFDPNQGREPGDLGSLESPQNDDSNAVDPLDVGLSGEWETLGDAGTGKLRAIEDNVFTPLEIESEPALTEDPAPTDDDDDDDDDFVDAVSVPDEVLSEVATNDVLDFDDQMTAIADASPEPPEAIDFATDDINLDAQAIEQPDLTPLPDPCTENLVTENLDGELDPEYAETEAAVDLDLDPPEAPVPADMAESLDVADGDEPDVLLDPFGNWSEDDAAFDDLSGVDLPELKDARLGVAEGEMLVDNPLDSPETDSDLLADLDEDNTSFIAADLGDAVEEGSERDSMMDAEEEPLPDPFADLDADNDGLDGLDELGAEETDLADGDFATNTADGDDLDLLTEIDGDDAVLSNLEEADFTDPFSNVGGEDDNLGDLGDLDLADLGGMDNDLADDDLSLAELSLDATEPNDLGANADSDFIVDPFADLDDADLGTGSNSSLDDLSNLDSSNSEDVAIADPFAEMDDDPLAMEISGNSAFPDLNEADGDVGGDDLLNAAVLDSIQALDNPTAELDFPNLEDNAALGLTGDFATAEEPSTDDADLLSFTGTDDELDLDSLALESELELAELDDSDNAANNELDLSFDGIDSGLTLDELAIADDENGDDGWQELGSAGEINEGDDWAIADPEELNEFDLDSLESENDHKDNNPFGSNTDNNTETDPFDLSFESET